MKPAFLICSNEHNAWWMPNSHGYTTYAKDAGTYSLEEADEICRGACYGTMWMDRDGHTTPNEVMVPSPEWLSELSKSKQKTP